MHVLNSQDYNRQKTFTRLYDPAHDRLCRFVQSQIWDRENARDIIAETAAIAYEKYDEAYDPATFPYFLFGIAARQIKRHYRYTRLRSFLRIEHAALEVVHGPAELNLMKRELQQAMSQLPPKQRESIALFEISGFSIKEIATMTGQSETAVKSQLSRGRQQLALLLKEPKVSHDTIKKERKTYE